MKHKKYINIVTHRTNLYVVKNSKKLTVAPNSNLSMSNSDKDENQNDKTGDNKDHKRDSLTREIPRFYRQMLGSLALITIILTCVFKLGVFKSHTDDKLEEVVNDLVERSKEADVLTQELNKVVTSLELHQQALGDLKEESQKDRDQSKENFEILSTTISRLTDAINKQSERFSQLTSVLIDNEVINPGIFAVTYREEISFLANYNTQYSNFKEKNEKFSISLLDLHTGYILNEGNFLSYSYKLPDLNGRQPDSFLLDKNGKKIDFALYQANVVNIVYDFLNEKQNKKDVTLDKEFLRYILNYKSNKMFLREKIILGGETYGDELREAANLLISEIDRAGGTFALNE